MEKKTNRTFFNDFSRGIRAAALLAGLTFSLLQTACEKDEDIKIRLVVDSQLSVPDELDEINVTVTASETQEGKLCRPASKSIILEKDNDLPVIVYYVIGEQYKEWIAFRIQWLSNDTPLYTREIIRPISDVKTQQIEVTFESSCVEKSCGEGQQCVSGICEDLHQPSPFDNPGIVDTSVSCD